MKSQLTFVVLLLAVGSVSADDAKPEPVKIIEQWSHVYKTKADESLKVAAPKSGYIATAKQWKTLWNAWRNDEAVPKIDFTKEFVLVGMSSGPNRLTLGAALDEHGNLKVSMIQTLIGGDGFGYHMIRISRDGVKSMNGKPFK